jgi:hypothetical protein
LTVVTAVPILMQTSAWWGPPCRAGRAPDGKIIKPHKRSPEEGLTFHVKDGGIRLLVFPIDSAQGSVFDRSNRKQLRDLCSSYVFMENRVPLFRNALIFVCRTFLWKTGFHFSETHSFLSVVRFYGKPGSTFPKRTLDFVAAAQYFPLRGASGC